MPTTRYAMPSKTEKLSIQPINIDTSTSEVIIGLLKKHKTYANMYNGIQAGKVIIASYQSDQNKNKIINFSLDLNSKINFDWA